MTLRHPDAVAAQLPGIRIKVRGWVGGAARRESDVEKIALVVALRVYELQSPPELAAAMAPVRKAWAKMRELSDQVDRLRSRLAALADDDDGGWIGELHAAVLVAKPHYDIFMTRRRWSKSDWHTTVSLLLLPLREALHNIGVPTGATKPSVTLVKILRAAVKEIDRETPTSGAIVLYVRRLGVKKNRTF